jgi:O-antigen/teichoic acid export membrane protein
MSQVLTGQIIWAICQTVVVLVLSHQAQFSIIGFYSFSLSIFAPLCLAGSFNLRTFVVVGDEAEYSPASVILLRMIVVGAAFAITVTCVCLLADNVAAAVAASALLALRAVDQISDAAIGFYQRNSRFDRVGRSFALRGVAGALPFLALTFSGVDVFSAAIITLVIVGPLVAYFDLLPLLQQSGSKLPWTEGVKKLVFALRHSSLQAFFPLLDNLQFNSFRYAAFFYLPTVEFAFVGLAHILYGPFQLLTSAFGFKFLSQAAGMNKEKQVQSQNWHLIRGVLIGAFISLLFLVGVIVAPVIVLELLIGKQAAEAVPFLEITAIAMLPVAAAGFVSLSLAARKTTRAYAAAPLVSLVVFMVVLFGAVLLGYSDLLLFITATYVICYMIRILISVVSFLNAKPA